MAKVSYDKLVSDYKRNAESADRALRSAIDAGEIKSRDFDELGRLFEACFGFEAYARCRANRQTISETKRVSEADGAVSTTAFQNISGQIVYSKILERYKGEEWVFKDLIPEVNATILDGEKMAGLSRMGNVVGVRKEGDPYKLAGIGEDWIFTPPIPDRGVMVPVTWEAVFNDRTGQLLDYCGEVGYWAAYAEEELAIDCLIDENVTDHRYNWRGTVIASYDDNTGNHTWDNLTASNALVDWTDIDAAEQVFNGLVDPFTGTPIMIEPRHLVVYKGLEQTARRIISATEIDVATPGYATSGNPTRTKVGNPYNNKYELKTSRLLASRLATDTSWFLGDISKYAVRMVAEPMDVVQAPSNNEDEFERRIVQKYRVNKRYAHTVVQPRAMVKSTVA
jgi:hypothetical protein